MKRSAALKRSGFERFNDDGSPRWKLDRKAKMPKRRKGPRLVKLADGTKARKKDLEDGPQAALCRRLPCVVCFVTGIARGWDECGLRTFRWLAETGGRDYYSSHAQAHHEEHTRGSGRGRDEHCLPACERHHTERHTMPREKFEAKYGIDLLAVVRILQRAVALGKEAAANG